MPVGVLAFWIGMGVSVHRFSSEYDWRYLTISQLLYPERNPDGHLWASGALALCALAGLTWSIAMRGERVNAIYTLGAGYLFMITSSVLPERLLPVPHAHEGLAIAGFAGLCAGLIGVSRYYFSLARKNLTIPGTLLAGVALTPIIGAGVTQAYLSLARPQLPWVGLAWRSLGVPVIFSFALWEWITCAVLSVYMAGIGYALGERTWKTPRHYPFHISV
jgi:hypothetical protein